MKRAEYTGTLRRMFSYIRPYRLYLVLSIAAALLSVASMLVFPLLTGRAVDAISTGEIGLFARAVTLMALSAALTALFQFLQNLCNNRMAYSISRDMRGDLFAKLQRLPLSYIDSHPHGDVSSRMINDVDQVSDGLLMGFTQLFSGILTILGTLACMLTVSWVVTLVVVIVTPVSLFTASFIARRTYSYFYSQSEAKGAQTSFIDEMVTGASVVSAYSMEGENQKRFDEINHRYSKVSLSAVFYSSLTNPVTRFVNSLVYMGVALSGGLSCVYGLMSVGGLSSILTYASQYTKPFNEISGVMTEFQNAVASAARIFSLLDEKEERGEEGLAELDDPEGHIRFDSVSFSYDKSRTLITDLSLDVRPGMRVAIVGPTGCGKTTLINLLMRFYEPDEGCIEIDGHDISGYTRHSVRRSYGMVLQDTWIKRCSVRENIALSRPDASEEEIRRAAELCHIDKFIAALPSGYDELISDESDGISEGQRQLISIARVMLSEPDMLILDEATSSIDTRTELLIQDAFSRLMEGRTSFIVAHRLSTIRNADLILVMKDGNVIESGSHDSLMEQGGFYSELYTSQFSG